MGFFAVPKFFDLVKDLDPNGICVDILHACPPRPPPGEIAVPLSSAKKLPPNLARLSASIDKTLKAELGSNCDTCKAVITEAALLLSNPVSVTTCTTAPFLCSWFRMHGLIHLFDCNCLMEGLLT